MLIDLLFGTNRLSLSEMDLNFFPSLTAILTYALAGLMFWSFVNWMIDNYIKNHHRHLQRLQSNGTGNCLKTTETDPIGHLPRAPGPLSLPIIGHIHLLAKYSDNPWYGFDQIRSQYGDVVSLKLGSFPAIMISSVDSMREVLLTKGEHFCNRPHFNRHALYFNNDRQNALALCDWTDVHKQRRSIAHAAVIPRFGTISFQRLSTCIQESIDTIMTRIEQSSTMVDDSGRRIQIFQKNLITEQCCSLFFHYLLDRNLATVQDGTEESTVLKRVAEQTDMVFYDINQMNISDFIPMLQKIGSVKSYFEYLFRTSNWICKQMEKVVMERFEQMLEQKKNGTSESDRDKMPTHEDKTEENNQKLCDERFVDRILLNKQYKSSAKFLDFILEHYLENKDTITWNEVMYEIGDLVGGNSAVANLLYRMLGHLAVNPESQQMIYEEVKALQESKAKMNPKSAGNNHSLPELTIEDQHRLPLLNAGIMEALRLALSPIVPHLSRWDTSLQGYFVPKGTMILFNIYHLNLSPDLYANPFQFDPKRFITKEGALQKPEHFFPFSHGRRSCLGYKMVYTITCATVANLLLKFRLVPLSTEDEKWIRQCLEPKGSIALPWKQGECYNIGLISRTEDR